MIQVIPFERRGYTLLIVEVLGFKPLDIEKIQYPDVEGKKGVAIATVPECDLVVVGDLFSHYRNRSIWQGAYNPRLHGILVGQSFSKEIIRGEVIECHLPCLACWREGEDKLLKLGTARPYCKIHYDCSPHRKKTRKSH